MLHRYDDLINKNETIIPVQVNLTHINTGEQNV